MILLDGMSDADRDDAPVRVGDVLAGKYRVEEVLGVGGMGAVVAARNLELDELRALKFMLPKVSSDQAAAKRFLQEARAAARLRSEHVATIHDVGRLEGGEPYLVMEYLEGEDLHALLARRPRLPIEEACGLALQVVAGLAAAHAVGIVHRDLKPPNVFVCQGSDGLPRAKILDFGVSKLLGPADVPDVAMTATNALFGSPHYMSPEQMECTRDVDARTDIWSVGVLLYEMLTGEMPFDAASITALTVLVVNKEPRAPRELRPEIPAALEGVILRCLEKDPAARYPTVAELAAGLAPFAPAHDRALGEHVKRVLAKARSRASLSTDSGLEDGADGGATAAPAPAGDAGAAEPSSPRPAPERPGGAAAPRGRRLVARAAIGAAAAGVLAIGALVLARGREAAPAPPTPSAAADTPRSPRAPGRPRPGRLRDAGAPAKGKAAASATPAPPTASASAAPVTTAGDDPYDLPGPRQEEPYD